MRRRKSASPCILALVVGVGLLALLFCSYKFLLIIAALVLIFVGICSIAKM